MSNNAVRFSGHGDRGVKGRGKKGGRNTNNRTNKCNGVGESEPKQKWEEDRISRGKAIHIQPKNLHQEHFLRSMRENVISIGSGSAGTGKSYLACYYAASELLAGNIKKIVITRPYVAVSNRTTGYKPGEDLDKLRAFLLPLIGYLSDVLGKGMVEEHLLLADKIELAPLESIRGRSFDNAIIIVDEAANTTIGEIQALSTRLGENTRMVCIGDCAQSDTRDNGLKWFENLVLKHHIQGVGVVRFNHDDIVRSDIVRQLVIAFEREGGYVS